jgi:hypothetical protein
VLAQRLHCPVVVVATADHELDLIVRGEMSEVAPEVPGDFARAGRLQIDDAAHPRVDRRDVDRTRGFQRHLVTRVAQKLQQHQAALLRQRLAAGDADMAHAMFRHLGEDRVNLPPLPAVKGVRGIAVSPQRRGQTGEAHEYRGPADLARFALHREKDLGELEAIGGVDGLHGHVMDLGATASFDSGPSGLRSG